MSPHPSMLSWQLSMLDNRPWTSLDISVVVMMVVMIMVVVVVCVHTLCVCVIQF